MRHFPKLTSEFRELLNAAKGRKIILLGHVRPDGDCASSMFVMADILRKSGAAEVLCVDENPLPRLYENFEFGEKINLAKDVEASADYCTICVDCSNFSRSGEEAKKFAALEFLGVIDHHVSDNYGAKYTVVDSEAAAAAELIAGLLLDADIEISKENAMRLYMGMMMDTRQLTTSAVDARAFQIATALVERGASPFKVALELYQRETFAKMKLLATYLQTLTMHFDGRVCIGLIKSGVYEQTGAEKADTEGLVDYARSIDGVQIAALLECIPAGVKGSLRSKGLEFRVNEIAEVFGGGGHMAAAGFTVKGTDINTFYPKFLEEIGKHLVDGKAPAEK